MRIALILAAGLALIALAGCREQATPEIDPSRFDAAAQTCEKRGGRWLPRAESGAMVCLRTPATAGQSCSASGDCDGLCLARSRSCAPVVPLFGCNEALDSRGNPTRICLQ